MPRHETQVRELQAQIHSNAREIDAMKQARDQALSECERHKSQVLSFRLRDIQDANCAGCRRGYFMDPYCELSVDILAPGGEFEGAIGGCERTQSKDDYLIPDAERTAHDQGNDVCRDSDKM